MRKSIGNRAGIAYLWVCILVLAGCMLFSVLLLDLGIRSAIDSRRREVEAKLDGCLTSFAVGQYDSIKTGTPGGEAPSPEALRDDVLEALGFSDESVTVSPGAADTVRMTRPEVEVSGEDGWSVTVRYTALVPVCWSGTVFEELEVPVRVTRSYRAKGGC